MFKMHEKPKTMLANKSLVQEFVDMAPAPYDRPLSERRLQVYERILNQKLFRPVTWASVICKETNCTYRVNGKHTSVLLSNKNPIPEFYVIVERWICDTLNDVGILYNTYDSNLASRSVSDINLSFASTITELKGIPSRFINLVVSSAASLKWPENELRKIPPAERAEQLIERVDFVPWLQEVCRTSSTERMSTNNSKHLLRTSVVRAMMATYDRAPQVAKEFWIAVRDESAPDRNSPSRILARFLVRAIMAGGSSSRGGKGMKITTDRETFVKCIHAWNAHRSGEPTSLAYYAKADLPKISK